MKKLLSALCFGALLALPGCWESKKEEPVTTTEQPAVPSEAQPGEQAPAETTPAQEEPGKI